ncbi:MAG: hypothetical protein AAB948_01135 [Patescibacteria group bacterium]
MTEPRVFSRWHKLVAIGVISFISFAGLESLAYISNLYQMQLYLQASGMIYFFMILWLYFLFDVHYKEQSLISSNLSHFVVLRFKHFLKWEHLRYFQNYLILPGILYWGAVILIGINFQQYKLQQFIIIATSISLITCYTFFKEVFHKREINTNHFIILTYVKLYASWLIYAASLGIIWYYCFTPTIFYLVIFLVTFMLLYQALFQFAELSLKHVFYVFIISALLSAASYFVYKLWNVNYFSAGLFMTAVYNLLWNLFYNKINNTLSARVLAEQVTIFVLIVVMVLGVTNFKARIERCQF